MSYCSIIAPLTIVLHKKTERIDMGACATSIKNNYKSDNKSTMKSTAKQPVFHKQSAMKQRLAASL